MSARKARGNAATGAPAPALRAAALMAAPCEIQRSVTQPAPSGQASACKPNQPAPAPRQAFKATAPQGFEPRPAGAECVPNEAAPSGRIIDASIPLALFSIPGGLTMARTAPSFFYDRLKFVPLGGFLNSATENSTRVGKPLNLRIYTLCEVDKGNRQSVPPRKL